MRPDRDWFAPPRGLAALSLFPLTQSVQPAILLYMTTNTTTTTRPAADCGNAIYCADLNTNRGTCEKHLAKYSPPTVCDGCGEECQHWTVVKGFDLLCDPCMFKRMHAR